MSTLEAALRGGAVALLLLDVALRGPDLRSSRLSRYSVLFFLGVAAFVVDSAPGFRALDLHLRIPIHILSNTTPAMFWITAAALFDDEFTARWHHALAWLGLAVLSWREMFAASPAIVAAHDAASLLCVLFGIWHALAGRATDLVEWRRRFRVELAVCTALYIALIIVSQRLWPGSLGVAPFSLVNAIGVAGLAFLFAWLRLSLLIRGRSALDAPQGGSAPPVENDRQQAAPTGQEAALLEALRKLMEEGRVYREDGLSIASLSQSLGVQEYRLRRLINGQLGHRNFSAFVNGYRLAETVAALADPGQTDVPILTIALDAGFGSIGPFNRAFKAHTGLTPTEYRRTRLEAGEAAAPLPIPESASRS
jgi:AraC-like DNA-binding protein